MAGSAFGLVVVAEDPFGNVDTNFNGSVAVALSNNPGGATLGGTLNVTAQNGVATFSDLTLDKPGIGYTLQVSTIGLTAATTNPFNVQTSIATVAVGWGAQTATLQTAADGLRLLPAGRNTDLPWLGINQLQITLGQAATLSRRRRHGPGASGINYGPVTVSGSGTSYTITLAQPINEADRVTITIGNALIASFTRRLDVLPGDVNDDGVVNSQDMVVVRNEMLGLLGAVPTIFGDINGDGKVDINDYNAPCACGLASICDDEQSDCHEARLYHPCSTLMCCSAATVWTGVISELYTSSSHVNVPDFPIGINRDEQHETPIHTAPDRTAVRLARVGPRSRFQRQARDGPGAGVDGNPGPGCPVPRGGAGHPGA